MKKQKKSYSPPPRRRSSDIVRKDLRRRLRGKPTRSSNLPSIPQIIGLALTRTISLIIIVLILIGFVLAGLGSGMLVGYISTAEHVVTEQIKNKNETSKILDDQGNEIAILTGSQNINREYVPFSSIKHTYIDEAFIAIEDERFREHPGIDIRRIGSAVLSALANGGSATHGGSTITQQTVRLISGEDMRSAQRKVQEWYKALLLEQEKSKDEIMELYINLAPMGNSYVGIQSAAKAYFDKDAADLNLVECAFLAGVPNRPSTYNPMTETGRRNALRRMRIVLGKMYELEMISKSQYERALNTELVFRQKPQTLTGTQINSYFVDYVIKEVIQDLVERRGYSRDMATIAVYNYGLTIETTMAADVQAAIESTFNTENLFVKDRSKIEEFPEAPNGSIVVMSNQDPGQIKGMVGGYGEKTGNFIINRAADSRRSPGSSIKPLAVYGPALDTGIISASTIFDDHEIFYNRDEPTKPYPRNSYSGYRGNMTVRHAVVISSNTIAVQVLMKLLGIDTAQQYLTHLGISFDKVNDSGPALGLGSLTYGTTSLEMAAAYSAFANGGIYTEPYAYTRVLDADGTVLLENKPTFREIFKPTTAYVVTSILHDVTVSGTASIIGGQVGGVYAAGKTGTTDDYRDRWFCGYTPYYSAAVWYGYDNRLGFTQIPSGDRTNAIHIWQDAMTKIHEGLEPIEFEPPSGLLTMTICKDSGSKANPYCPETISEYFIPGAILNPSSDCILHEPEPTPTPTPEPVSTDPIIDLVPGD
ncbi:MAG: transglycosylase domain-containing protein [Saccharofermentanales bacterium]|nr:penicillin-binding protein [Clostridiaceae bacterium]